MDAWCYYTYISFAGADFFTVILLPDKEGNFPAVIVRTPYVQAQENKPEDEILAEFRAAYAPWTERGYAVVLQHCRGQGKSTGAFIPYVHEHEDGRFLREWIRRQPFYNGELFLLGGSYTASLHYATAPFESDIKGAVWEVQDTERYRLWYRNGQMRKGHANWHFGLYKAKCGLTKHFSMDSFSELPLAGLSQRVLGERCEDFEQMLEADRPEHPFWNTRNGGADAKNATDEVPFPVLFTTGYNDFYVGGMFRMWEQMNPSARNRCAMLVSPYDHGDGYHPTSGIAFPDGRRREHFGKLYPIDWMDHIRLGTPIPYEKGVITYYRMFEDRWAEDFARDPVRECELPLGEDTVRFFYDPMNPPCFPSEGHIGRPACCEGHTVSLGTTPLSEDVFVKGRIKARLWVASDCADTTFYVNLGIETPDGVYRLRHDITSLSFALGQYEENTAVPLDFTFDDIAFLLKKGQRLRLDIGGTDGNSYVSHTNCPGAYARQTEARMAHNTVFLARSVLVLPVEQKGDCHSRRNVLS